MLFNHSPRLAQVISVAALSIGIAFVAKPAQQAPAQVGVGSGGINGVGESAITAPAVLENWFFVNIVGFDSGEPFTFSVDGFANYAITGTGNGRRAFNDGINGLGLGLTTNNFPFELAHSPLIPFGENGSTTAIDADEDGVNDTSILNVNPINISVAFPTSAVNPPRFTIPELCRLLSGQDHSFVLVYRQDCGGITSIFDEFIEVLCNENQTGVDINGDGDTNDVVFDLSNDEGDVRLSAIDRNMDGFVVDPDGNIVSIASIDISPADDVLDGIDLDARDLNPLGDNPNGVTSGSIADTTGLDANGDLTGVPDGVVDALDLIAAGSKTVGALQAQGVNNTILATPEAIGYNDSAIAASAGFGPIGNNNSNPNASYAGLVNSEADPFNNNNPGFAIAVGPSWVGFYQNYPSAIQTDFAGNLCIYITTGLDFGEIGGVPVGFQSGRNFAVSQGYLPPSFGAFPAPNGSVNGGNFNPNKVNLDSNCLSIFGLGGVTPVPQEYLDAFGITIGQ